MLIVILKDNQADQVTQALTTADYRVTRVASTSGFLRRGVVTLFSGMEDELVDDAIDLIRAAITDTEISQEIGVTLFVTPLSDFKKI